MWRGRGGTSWGRPGINHHLWIFTMAAALAAQLLAACASGNVVRAPVHSPPDCADARFLYTDWSTTGDGTVGIYRCGESPSDLPQSL